MRDHFNEFSKRIETLARTHDLSRVFNDLLTMAICSYNRTNIQSRLAETDPKAESLYQQTIKPYSKEELIEFGKLLGEIQLKIYDDPYSDMLGQFHTEHVGAKSSKQASGQFFTPEPICDLMSGLVGQEEQIEHQTILDPTCGSGRTLLSFAKQHPNNYFFGADVSDTCVKMSAVNFFLNGLKGEITHMNSLTMEFYKAWHINMDGLGIQPIDKEQSQIWSKPPEPPKEKEEGKQLILF